MEPKKVKQKSVYRISREMEGEWPNDAQIKVIGYETWTALQAAIDSTMAVYDRLPANLVTYITKKMQRTAPKHWLSYEVNMMLYHRDHDDRWTDRMDLADEAGKQLIGKQLSAKEAREIGNQILDAQDDADYQVRSWRCEWYNDVVEYVYNKMIPVLGQYLYPGCVRYVHVRDDGTRYEIEHENRGTPAGVPIALHWDDREKSRIVPPPGGRLYDQSFPALIAAKMIRYPLTDRSAEIDTRAFYGHCIVW